MNGAEGTVASDGVCRSGLPCVVILVGAFHKTTGQPIAGAINQPFASRGTTDDQYVYQCRTNDV